MRILCLIKLVPDVDKLRYDPERNILLRDGASLGVNPEDGTAAAVALGIKSAAPGTYLEAACMAPKGAMPHLEDLVRRGFDRAALVCDSRFAGSDTWATSRVLAEYLRKRSFDCLFCGTHTLDGGTAQVPAQIAELLGLPHMAHISPLSDPVFSGGRAEVDVEDEGAYLRFSLALPAVLGFLYAPQRKLPYIRYQDMDRDVSGSVSLVGNAELGLPEEELGLAGSLTQVKRLDAAGLERKDPVLVRADGEGIETVFRFLDRLGFVKP